MTARRLAYLLILQICLLCIGGGVLVRHAFADTQPTTAPLVFVVTHDAQLVASNQLSTLYALIADTLSSRTISAPVGIIRASDEPLYLVPDTSDTASLLTALPLLPQLAPQETLTSLFPTLTLLQKHVTTDAQLIFLTNSSLLTWQSERSPQLTSLASTYHSVIIVDTNPNSRITSQGFKVISPAQLTDYLATTTSVVDSKNERLRLFLVLLGI